MSRRRAWFALLPLLVSGFLAPAALAGDRRLEGRPAPDEREVISRMLEILQRPEFEGSEEEEEGLLLLMANLLSDLLDWIKELRRTDPIVYATIVGWLVVTLLVIVAHVAWTIWRGGSVRGRRARGVDPLLDPALATRAGRDPERMMKRAGALAADGDFGNAVPWLYLSLLFRLERAGHVEFDPARTGLEYADALARQPEQRSRWMRFLDVHDPVVFGRGVCSEDTFSRLRDLVVAPLEQRGADA